MKRHVGEVVDATIVACESVHGKTIGEMCSTMMNVFVGAKTRRLEVSRALYLPSAAVNADAIVKEESSRCAQAVHDMLITASDATFAQPRIVSGVLIASIVGPTRTTIEAGGNRSTFDRLKRDLTALCVGYLKEVSTTTADQPPRGRAQGEASQSRPTRHSHFNDYG